MPALQTITIGTNAITLVPMPPSPGPRMVEPWVNDTVATVTSEFTGQVQRQGSTGADSWGLMVTLPKLTAKQAPAWIAWFLQMQGMARATQMTPPPPSNFAPPLAGSAPVIDIPAGSTNNAAGTKLLSTRGWKASQFHELPLLTAFQIGYRMHWMVDHGGVESDATGHSQFEIWPSLRELPTDGTALQFNKPMGLFGLADNKRNWTYDITRLSSISFPLVEYR